MNSNSVNCNGIEAEFKAIEFKEGWGRLFQEIREDSSKNDFTLSAAAKNRNKNLNRYRDVSPYDHSRIVLSKGKCDYINASLVKVEKAKRHYILTQGPLLHTTGHFWLMVWEQNCKAIIMLNRVIEKKQEKCFQYWPSGAEYGGSDTITLNDAGMKIDFISESKASYYTTRVFRLTDLDSGDSREVLQYHYTTWPDFGVPQSPNAFLRFLAVVRASGSLSDTAAPPIVHCSAGIGRSGTFILVDSSLVLMKEYGVESVNVRELLMEMRRYRMGLIQTADQLRFSYLAIIHALSNNQWDSLSAEGSEEESSGGESMVESVGSSDDVNTDSDSDVPPPPPPRSESLHNPPPREPPPPPPQEESQEESALEKKHNDNCERLAQRVNEMKRKQEAAESWSRTKRSLLSPFSLSVGALVLGLASAFAYAIYNRN